MNVFLTGATGYIGFAVAQRLAAGGHRVRALSRAAAGDARLAAIGAEPVRGNLHDADFVARSCRAADAVIHTAFEHHLDRAAAIDFDGRLHEAFVAALRDSGKVLIVTSSSGIFGDTGARAALESDVAPGTGRAQVERIVLAAPRDLRAIVIRPPVIVYGRGGSVFVPMMIGAARRDRVSYCVGAGDNRLTTVHVEPLADLYALALAKGMAGSAYHAAGPAVTQAALAGAVARLTRTPIKTIGADEAAKVWHPVWARMLACTNLIDGARAQGDLGWSAAGFPAVTEDIVGGSYAAN